MINKNAKISLMYDLDNLHHVVVQAGFVDQDAVYALQLLHKQNDTIIYQAGNRHKHVLFDEANPIFYLNGPSSSGSAGGHTQTWVKARDNQFFVGVKPKKHGSIYWDTQIARLDLDKAGTYNSNTDFSRLSYLNRAGKNFGDGSCAFPGSELERLEAAVSPDMQHFLIASIDLNHVGHFALYNLSDINQALDAADGSDVNIETIPCQGAFMVPDFNTSVLKSIQGYGIDNQNNIYISSQPGPTAGFLGRAKEGHPREIVKLTWGETDPNKWEVVNLDDDHTVDSLGYVTEFESVQVIDENKMYLTVAYHEKSDMTTLKNRIYQVEFE